MNRSHSIEKIARVYKLGEEPKDSVYWRTRPAEERVAVVEILRSGYHGWTDETHQNFKEFAQSLNDNGVRYLVVGGYAVAAHGRPRYKPICASRRSASRCLKVAYRQCLHGKLGDVGHLAGMLHVYAH